MFAACCPLGFKPLGSEANASLNPEPSKEERPAKGSKRKPSIELNAEISYGSTLIAGSMVVGKKKEEDLQYISLPDAMKAAGPGSMPGDPAADDEIRRIAEEGRMRSRDVNVKGKARPVIDLSGPGEGADEAGAPIDGLKSPAATSAEDAAAAAQNWEEVGKAAAERRRIKDGTKSAPGSHGSTLGVGPSSLRVRASLKAAHHAHHGSTASTAGSVSGGSLAKPTAKKVKKLTIDEEQAELNRILEERQSSVAEPPKKTSTIKESTDEAVETSKALESVSLQTDAEELPDIDDGIFKKAPSETKVSESVPKDKVKIMIAAPESGSSEITVGSSVDEAPSMLAKSVDEPKAVAIAEEDPAEIKKMTTDDLHLNDDFDAQLEAIEADAHDHEHDHEAHEEVHEEVHEEETAAAPKKKKTVLKKAGKFIGRAIKKTLISHKTAAAPPGSVIGVWEADTASLRCRVCNDLFNLKKRRHHCRHCGQLVCEFCSGARVYLEEISTTELVRVCDTCLKGQKFQTVLPHEAVHREFKVKKPAEAAVAEEGLE